MNQPEAKDKIVSLLEEIVERAHFINQNHPQKDLSMDLDTVMEDLRSLYRQFQLLKKENAEQNQFIAPEQKPEITKDSPGSQQTPEVKTEEPRKHLPFVYDESEPEPSSGGEVKQPGQTTEQPHTSQETVSDKKDQPVASPQTPQEEKPASPDKKTGEEEKEKEKTPVPEEPGGKDMQEKPLEQEEPQKPSLQEQAGPQKQMEEKSGDSSAGNGSKAIIDLFSDSHSNAIGDQYRQDDNSLHQRISGKKEDQSIGTRMQQKGISSLKEAIGVNDKFLFINELFNGNIQAYNEAITKLNNSASLNDAFEYLNRLNQEFAWDARRSEQTIEKLAAFVQRRYAGN